ncbi:methyltransferase domain-containing protein [Micromonospora polyrhachis]|uniref:SAM-dependent methyltransferase n=1 Tax=Micromonospora polyrhachis TaxID=1282883 RepID=A0A7W7SUU9_9ACTN|nr:class I SAM-dependent methyltransferase [Micromonospora polyrhachis]MBB4961001.1 SAM-dependent methyltransferase [Micromonospora polyrhachis]
MTAVALRQVFDSDEEGGRRVLDYLSTVLDGFTCDRLGRAGVAWGGRCWEVGAGNGSVAGWLGDRIGPTGEVIATGLCPDLVRSHPRVTVIGRNDERDPLLGGVFDLVHARLVFAGWPQRWELVHRYARALAPGRPLVIEDWGRCSGLVLSSPVPDAAGVYCRFRSALAEVFTQAGGDLYWVTHTAAAMADAGLVEVDTAVHAQSWRGGTAGYLLPLTVARTLRGPLLEAGVDSDDLDALAEVLTHPETVLLGDTVFSTIGRRQHT